MGEREGEYGLVDRGRGVPVKVTLDSARAVCGVDRDESPVKSGNVAELNAMVAATMTLASEAEQLIN